MANWTHRYLNPDDTNIKSISGVMNITETGCFGVKFLLHYSVVFKALQGDHQTAHPVQVLQCSISKMCWIFLHLIWWRCFSCGPILWEMQMRVISNDNESKLFWVKCTRIPVGERQLKKKTWSNSVIVKPWHKRSLSYFGWVIPRVAISPHWFSKRKQNTRIPWRNVWHCFC